METVIGLLFVLLPVILKLIGKKLEQSGESQKAETVRNLARKLDGDDDVYDWTDSVELETEPEPKVEYVPIVPKKTVIEPVVAEKVVRQTMPVEPKAPSQKIDPKKLVIYSEIMNPKYKD